MSVQNLYKSLSQQSKLNKKGLNSVEITEQIAELAEVCHSDLMRLDRLDLDSRSISGKQYYVFARDRRVSRPINKRLFLEAISGELFTQYLDFDWLSITRDLRQKLLYTLAMSYCAHRDTLADGDKKTPSIFFEIFIGNLFAREYGINPTDSIEVNIAHINTTLPTDYIFQPPAQWVNIHLPIKLSTRERSVQAWAHQRVLEGIHGTGKYRGVMVVSAETNFQSKDMSVVDVCLPEQWRLYQAFISRMTRVYYLDLPQKYSELIHTPPIIAVKELTDFFEEKAHIISPTLV